MAQPAPPPRHSAELLGMIACGLLPLGMVLTATRDGVTLQACVVLDGLNVKGTWKVYGYPSTAITDRSRIVGTLTRARRRDTETKAERIQMTLRAEQLTEPPALVAGYAATVRAAVAVITVFNAEIATLAGQVETHFGRHPDAEISVQPARAR